MKNNIISNNGLKVKKIYGDFTNKFSGRKNNVATGLFNTDGKVFALNGQPYFPVGGRLAFQSIVADGLHYEGYSFIDLPYNLKTN